MDGTMADAMMIMKAEEKTLSRSNGRKESGDFSKEMFEAQLLGPLTY